MKAKLPRLLHRGWAKVKYISFTLKTVKQEHVNNIFPVGLVIEMYVPV